MCNLKKNLETFIAGARDDIRDHMQKSTPETERKVWRRIVPLMYTTKTIYDFSEKLDDIVLDLVSILCGGEVE